MIHEDEQIIHTDLPDFDDTPVSPSTADVPLVSSDAHAGKPDMTDEHYEYTDTTLLHASAALPYAEVLLTQPNTPYFLSPDPVYWQKMQPLDTEKIYRQLSKKGNGDRLLPEKLPSRNLIYVISAAVVILVGMLLFMNSMF